MFVLDYNIIVNAILIGLTTVSLFNQDIYIMTKPIMKPFLMAFQMFVYFSSIKKNANKQKRKNLSDKYNLLVFIALLCSLIADCLIDEEEYFIYGIFWFLATHIFYIWIFYQDSLEKEIKKDVGKLAQLLITVPYVVSALLVMKFLQPHLGENALPVNCYAVIIITMARLSWIRYSKVSQKSYYFVMIGAIIFIISDLTIAVMVFVKENKYLEVMIGSTYLIAQYLIVQGFIEGNRERKTDGKIE